MKYIKNDSKANLVNDVHTAKAVLYANDLPKILWCHQPKEDTKFTIELDEHNNAVAWEHIDEVDVENEPMFIDLGLPSGTKWCKFNLGTEDPCEFGKLYLYGRIDGATSDDFNTVLIKQTTPDTVSGNTYSNNMDNLIPGDDAAVAFYNSSDVLSEEEKGKVATPTAIQWQELINNTDIEYVICDNNIHDGMHSGIHGLLFVSRQDSSKKVFIPAQGYYYIYNGGGFNMEGNNSLFLFVYRTATSAGTGVNLSGTGTTYFSWFVSFGFDAEGYLAGGILKGECRGWAFPVRPVLNA